MADADLDQAHAEHDRRQGQQHPTYSARHRVVGSPLAWNSLRVTTNPASSSSEMTASSTSRPLRTCKATDAASSATTRARHAVFAFAALGRAATARCRRRPSGPSADRANAPGMTAVKSECAAGTPGSARCDVEQADGRREIGRQRRHPAPARPQGRDQFAASGIAPAGFRGYGIAATRGPSVAGRTPARAQRERRPRPAPGGVSVAGGAFRDAAPARAAGQQAFVSASHAKGSVEKWWREQRADELEISDPGSGSSLRNGCLRIPEQAADGAGHGRDAGLADAAHRHAQVLGLEDDDHAARARALHRARRRSAW